MLFVDITWRVVNEEIMPYMVFWNPESTKMDLQLLEQNEHISWTIDGPAMCIGYRDYKGNRIPCPEKMILQPGRTQCGPCSALDKQEPCARCDGTICSASAEKFEKCRDTEYAIYLVLIGDIIKVGVSTSRRVKVRWIEQGADYGTIVTTVKGGDKARRLESQISKLTDTSKAIRTSQKIKSMSTVIDIQIAESKINEILSDLEKSVSIVIPKIEALADHYGFSRLESIPQEISFNKKSQRTDIVGDVVGVKGTVMLISVPGNINALNLKKMRGRLVTNNPNASIIAQSGLDEFF